MTALAIKGMAGCVTEMLLFRYTGKDGLQECRPASRAKSYDITVAAFLMVPPMGCTINGQNQRKHSEGKGIAKNKIRTGLVV